MYIRRLQIRKTKSICQPIVWCWTSRMLPLMIWRQKYKVRNRHHANHSINQYVRSKVWSSNNLLNKTKIFLFFFYNRFASMRKIYTKYRTREHLGAFTFSIKSKKKIHFFCLFVKFSLNSIFYSAIDIFFNLTAKIAWFFLNKNFNSETNQAIVLHHFTCSQST